MRMERSFDVVVLGGGVTGLSTAYHLQRLGVQNLALASSAQSPAATAVAAGLIRGGQVDNYTRVSQAHTAERAAAMWRFGDAAFEALCAYADQAQVAYLKRRFYRLLTSPAELHEAGLAVKELSAAGLYGALLGLDQTADPLLEACKERVLGVQDDGPRGGWLDPQLLLAQLHRDTAAIPRLADAVAIEELGGGLAVRTAAGETSRCEIAVVAAHLQTAQLVPELAAALVPFADQWTEFTLSSTPADAPGVVYSANNTYEWGAFTAPDRLRLGGGRYLRPMAGLEATNASSEPKITKHLQEKLAETFTFGTGAAAGKTFASLDISPCDELPLVGPLYGSSRVLLASGFMGAGLTAGFWAGRCLAALIAHGECPDLPRFLWPERLRTLSS